MATSIAAPEGLVLRRLADRSTAAHTEARAFCLDVIKEFYGFDYRADWHEDLDSLCGSSAKNHYSTVNLGAFWTLSLSDGAIVAAAGVRAITWKPRIVDAYAERYESVERVGSLWRVYVRKDRRRRGLGSWLARLAEVEARRLGFSVMYLHANADAAATIAFWEACGYVLFESRDMTAHMDKPIADG
ncbi:MAG: GNAT family N-acetyltransferase [Proteobacteria bacterium]|nr:GNAT family N-acetyltransferase [Pseudomonadota bacterium]